MESANQFQKKLIKTMVCKAFSFHYLFHPVETTFTPCIAPFEKAFHKAREITKSPVFSIDSARVLMWLVGRKKR